MAESSDAGPTRETLDLKDKTHSCNCLTSSDEGSNVVLRGYVSSVRHKCFVILRDTYGKTQIVAPKQTQVLAAVQELTLESYIEVEGTVRRRPPGQENKSMATGEVEVTASALRVLGRASATLPFNISPHNMPTEAHGMKYRYLQLRLPYLRRNRRMRSQVELDMRNYLERIHSFINVTTPTLTRPTSGGAHQFIVPYASGSSAASSTRGSDGSAGDLRTTSSEDLPGNRATDAGNRVRDALNRAADALDRATAEAGNKATAEAVNIATEAVKSATEAFTTISSGEKSNSNSATVEDSSSGSITWPCGGPGLSEGGGSDRSDRPGLNSINQHYCLAQSPQTYKQLLMVGGEENYYQFALCYRDEKGTPERQPEFTQLDVEMADTSAQGVQALVEGLLVHAWPADTDTAGPPPAVPFPIMTYDTAMQSYGSDKPDTRFQWLLQDATAVLQETNCGGNTALQQVLADKGNTATAFVVPQGQKLLSKSVCEDWNKLAAREHRLGGVSVCQVREDGSLKGSKLASDLNKSSSAGKLVQHVGAVPGDAVVIAAGPQQQVLTCLGRLRLLSAAVLEAAGVAVRDKDRLSFLWVVHFPLFEVGEDGSGLVSVHHPFTRPHPDDRHLLETDPLKVRSEHYDLVCSGTEVGGGSVRIHEPDLQQRMLEMLHLPLHEFQYFIDALKTGAPPHAGIALGFDRLMALLCRSESIRDVIAYPKTSQGLCLMSGAPSDISAELKQRFGITK